MICPHCGADVEPRARACRECGSDERTGWSDGVDDLLPAEPVRERKASRGTGLVALAVLVLFASWAIGGAWALGGGALVVLAWLVVRRVRRAAPWRERALMRELARRARGDADLPERLVQSELARTPGIARSRAIERAIARLEHDRR